MVQQPVVQHQQVETTCGSLLRELQHIWDEVGESDSERDKMLLQLEQECLEVYRRKVDNASHARALLHQALANAESEFAALFSALGEPTLSQREKRSGTLKEQVAAIGPHLEELRQRKEDRSKQFVEVKTQIAKICGEIAGSHYGDIYASEDQEMTVRRLEDYHVQLATLQKQKSERLHKVLEYVNVVHELCSVLGMDFFQIINEVHPSLDDSKGQPKSISNETLDLLAKKIHTLQAEKKQRMSRLQDLGVSMIELWNLMDTPVEEQQLFQHVTCNIAASDDDITTASALSLETIEQAEIEVERLHALKSSKMKELVIKKRLDLEEICRHAHLEPDSNTTEDQLIALIDSGMVDPADLLTNLEEEINKAQQEVASRKEIMVLMEKWMSACEEEGWLEDYNKDENRFASKGAHLNLKRAEKARAAISKLPALVDSLTQRTRAWEEERGVPFMFDGVRLLAMLNEYNNLRQEKEEEKKRMRDQKKIHEQLINEQETLFGSKPSPNKGAMSAKKGGGINRTSSIGGGGQTQASRRLSLGSAIMQPGTPDICRNGINPSRLGASVGKDSKRERSRPSAPLNYVALNKDDTATAGAQSTVGARGQAQAQAQAQALLRQPLAPVLSPAAMFVDDAANRSTASLTNKPLSNYLKSPMASTPSSPRMGDLENTTPRQQLDFSCEERRASLSYVDRRTSFWMGADN